MKLSAIISSLLVCGLGASAVPPTTAFPLKTPSRPLLQWTLPPVVPQMRPAFQAKIDWDLDNNHTIQTPSGLRASWWSREGYLYDTTGRQFGEILRANDDGVVTSGTDPGTKYLELLISYVVKLDDGHWAYVKHTGGAIVRQYQNGIVRVETDSKKYTWLNRVDFIAPGTFNGTEVMTVNHYFPNSNNLPNGLPKKDNR
ncbi:hypothetical protein H634G_06287 [Metarhizium anisopliae BRIP 53293]|uniref:Outer membrane protein, beta-barrel n=1 Tax=Metarhizium anisopliae BRIP 53293 TaxID=1291518 RepID=A0A0D9NZX1_METAN|nr:hypothetical protein H634G_06287 [Metarhizium anisopliae BRIP 53293]KJK87271.1 hypothetical protein H633G_08843 [Metarhizium anisopliae BRIP 53284]